MGEDIYSVSDEARAIFEAASEVSGVDIADVCFGSQTERLEETLIAQPAIAAVSIAEYYHLKKLGLRPDVGMGHSMGEIPLLAMVGAISIRDTFSLLQVRAEATSRASQERPGIMGAVTGLTLEQVRDRSAHILDSGRAAIANLNSRYQQVFSGDHEPMQNLEDLIKGMRLTERLKVRYTRLRTGGAFHSPYHMENAVEEFYEAAQSVNFSAPEFNIILNNAQYVSELGTNNLARYLSEQLVRGVDFVGATERIVNDGVANFIEVGPIGPQARYKTLSSLIKRDFAKRVHIIEIMEVEDRHMTAERPEQR